MTLSLFTLLYLLAQEDPSPRQDAVISLETCLTTALAQDPNIQLSKQSYAIAQGRQMISQGRFDPRIEAASDISTHTLPDVTGVDSKIEQQSLSTTLTRQFRAGFQLSGDVSIKRTDLGNVAAVRENRGAVEIGIAYPLLRGRGRLLTTADERATQLELEAATQDLRYQVSLTILRVVNAYWDYVSQGALVAVLERSLQSAARLVEETSRLIEADELPANELLQLRANLAAKKAQLVAGGQRLEAAKHALGLAMGLSYEEIEALPPAEETLPTWSDRQPPPRSMDQTYMSHALDHRGDAHALRLRGEALDLDVLSSRDSLRASLDAKLTTGYNSLEVGGGLEPFGASLYANGAGINYKASLTYRFPVGNHSARGQFSEAHANREHNTIQFDNLRRNITARVAFSLDTLRRSFLELEANKESIHYYQLAHTNEQKKLRLGFSTLIDVINYEERLTAVQSSYINGHTDYLKGLAQLRFDTGTLLKKGKDLDALNPQQLLKWPF